MPAELPVFSTRQPGGMIGFINKEFNPGDVFFVGSTVSGLRTASDSAGYGKNPNVPYATLDYAIASCTADHGDKIIVLPGHAETITSVTVDISDVTIEGVGQGLNRPKLTLAATDSEVNVTADDVTIKNIWFHNTVDNLVNYIDADANSLIVDGCLFTIAAATEALCGINFATTKDYLIVRNCWAEQASDPAGTDQAASTGFLYVVDTENITFTGNTILGNWETAIIHNKTTACKYLYMHDNVLLQDLSTALLIEIVDGTIGSSRRDTGHSINADDATPAKCIGTYGTKFWFGTDSQFSNDSAAGGQGMIASEAACS